MNIPVIRSNYTDITMVRDVCEPWVELWAGDEWGDSMHHLLGACHTDYGLDDDDCAIVAGLLIKNVVLMYICMDVEGLRIDLDTSEDEYVATRAAACEARDYWLKGGNLGFIPGLDVSPSEDTLKLFPAWMFEKPIEVEEDSDV